MFLDNFGNDLRWAGSNQIWVLNTSSNLSDLPSGNSKGFTWEKGKQCFTVSHAVEHLSTTGRAVRPMTTQSKLPDHGQRKKCNCWTLNKWYRTHLTSHISHLASCMLHVACCMLHVACCCCCCCCKNEPISPHLHDHHTTSSLRLGRLRLLLLTVTW